MKRSLRKLIPTFVMLVITAALLGTSTFAWFSMNTKVTVTGMSVQTKVSSNIQIAAYDAGDANKGNNEASYMNSLSQTRTGTLEPVSTTNAEDFFYHATNEHVLGSGNVDDTTWIAYSEGETLPNTNAGKTDYDEDFQTNYGVNDAITTSNVIYGYLDYEFFLKANSTADNQVLKMTQCNLLYNNGALDETAYRVAVFAADSAKETGTTALGTLKTILTPYGAANFDPGEAVSAADDKDTVTYNTAAVIDNDIDAGDVNYYKIVVRLWLEGEDTTCNNSTFSTLTANWTLALGFELAANSTNAVTNIGTYGAKNNAYNIAAVTASGITPTAYQWYNNEGDAAIEGATSATYTEATSAKTVYCKITTAVGEFKTNTVNVTNVAP